MTSDARNSSIAPAICALACVIALPAERGAQSAPPWPDLRRASRAPAADRAGLPPSRPERSAPLVAATGSGLDVQLVDLLSTSSADFRLALGERREERLGDLFVGFLGEPADVRGCRFSVTSLPGFSGSRSRQHDHDQQHHADAGRHPPAHHQRVLVGARAGRPAAASARGCGRSPRPRAVLVVLVVWSRGCLLAIVEERQKLTPCRGSGSAQV